MATPKKFLVQINGRNNIATGTVTGTVTGTIAELANYFSYTLEVGNSWDKKISRTPKTIKSLISNVNKAYDAVAVWGIGRSIKLIETHKK